MANELQVKSTADSNVYAVIINADAQVWQTTTSTFVPIVDANWANYDVALVEQGTSTGIYVGDFPTGITSAGTYTIIAYLRAGGTPSVTDTADAFGTIRWDGLAEDDGTTADNLVSLAALKEYAEISGSSLDDKLTNVIAYVSGWIKGYCEQQLTDDTIAELYACEGNSYLTLNNKINASPTSVVFDYYTDNTTTIPVSEFYVMNGTLRFKPSSTYARAFVGLVAVSYTCGYETVPNKLKLAALMACKNVYDTSKKDGTVQSETLGSYSYVNKILGENANDPVMNQIKPMLAEYRVVPAL